MNKLNFLADSIDNIVVWAIVGGVVLLILIALIVITYILRKRKHKAAIKEIDKTSTTLSKDDFLDCLGGSSNIVSYSTRGSRINVVLKDYSLIKKEKFEGCGIDSSVLMSEKIVLVSKIAPALNAILEANIHQDAQ